GAARPAHVDAVDRRAAEDLAAARARPSPGAARARRARGEPGSGRAARFLEAAARERGSRRAHRALLVAHRFGPRTRREQSLDRQGRARRVAGRARRAEGVRRAAAHQRSSAVAGQRRHSGSARAPRRRHARGRRRHGLAAGRAGAARRAARRRRRGRAARPRRNLHRAALMTPVARLALTFFTAFPVQRALLVVVAILAVVIARVALGAGVPPVGSRWLYVSAVVAALFSAFVSFPSFLAFGTLFAALSAPRPFLLLPHFRRRMLAAALSVFAVSIAPVVALAAFAPPGGVALAVFGYGFAFFTWLALLATLRPTLLVLFMIVSLPGFGLIADLDAQAKTVVLPAVLAGASVAAWAAFARHYLRGKPVVVRIPVLRDLLGGNMPAPDGKLEAWQFWSADTSAEALSRNAVRVLLDGQLPTRPWPLLAMLAASVTVVALW